MDVGSDNWLNRNLPVSLIALTFGGTDESVLRKAGAIAVFRDPAHLLPEYDTVLCPPTSWLLAPSSLLRLLRSRFPFSATYLGRLGSPRDFLVGHNHVVSIEPNPS
jgi:hypothetical protein